MILADIGNSYTKIYESGHIRTYEHEEAKKRYKNKRVYYISVYDNPDVAHSSWVDISGQITLDTSYRGMGIDRKALCSAVDEGVLVDAGSAITVDVMQAGVHLGGYILPGIAAYQQCYRDISPSLNVEFNPGVDTATLPQNTSEAISYATVASINCLLKQTIRDKVYFTGGDGKFLSRHFDNAIYDATLVFKGMMKGLQ